MENYPQELSQDAVCQNHTGHMTGLWFLPTGPQQHRDASCHQVLFLQGLALKEIHAILRETSPRLFSGWAKDLSAHLYVNWCNVFLIMMRKLISNPSINFSKPIVCH